jgi:predicted  nucleic acid-binding Zn-ribbon protein
MANSIFGQGGEAKEEETFKSTVDTHSKALLTVVQRQKDLESSVDLLSEKLELLDHNAVKNFKKYNNEMKELRVEIRDLKVSMEQIKEFNEKVARQMKMLAGRDEVTKLEKYIDLWEPMNFLTRDEMEDFRSKIKEDFEKIIEKFLHEETPSQKKEDKKK